MSRPDPGAVAGACFLGCAGIVLLALASTLLRIYGPLLREFILAALSWQFAFGMAAGVALAAGGALVLALSDDYGSRRWP